MKRWATNKQGGFTIVELLIVVVVIAILATITIVAYNGIRERAQISGLQTALSQATKKVMLYAADHADSYPDTLADVGVVDSSTTVYQYVSDNTVMPKMYALSATNGPTGNITYSVSSAQSKQTIGIAPGLNTIAWYKSAADAPPPLNGGTVDASVSRTAASKSIRIGPANTGVSVRGSIFTGVVVGQTYTLELWLLTDSNWNGTANNSKVRFGDGTTGDPIKVCSYNGVKTTWTKITCPYKVIAGVSSFSLSVGNDGTTGNIWLDDISLTIQ